MNHLRTGTWALLAVAATACEAIDPRSPEGPTNLATQGETTYAAWGVEGIGVHSATGERLSLLDVPDGTGQIDDLSVAEGLLFAIDARLGRLVVYDLEDPASPALLGRPRAVDVGPFSGVSAGGGWVVVSGGTSRLTRFAYDDRGLAGKRATADLGLGQPDVLVAPDGSVAYVSTDFHDPVDDAGYGITTLPLDDPLDAADAIGLEGTGFTGGTTGPANFPVESAVAGDRLYVAHGGGLSVLDVSDPAAVVLVTTLTLPMDGLGVDVRGDRAWVVGSSPAPTVVAVDIEDPDTPEILATVEVEGIPRGITALDDGALVGAGPAGVLWVSL